MIPYDDVRALLEGMYEGVCTVSEYQAVQDPVTKVTKHQEVPVLTSQPCRLSFKTIGASQADDMHASAAQVTKLFITPDIQIKEGSKITVTQNGVTRDYQYSGIPAVYPTHQELILEIFKGWV